MWSALVGAGLSVANGIFNAVSSSEQRAEEQRRYEEQMKLQREQFDYQKYYDANKTQLLANDLQNAGLSKTLISGGAGSSSVTGTANPSSSPVKVNREFEGLSQALALANQSKQAELVESQIESQSADRSVLQYNLDWAKKHDMPYGSQPSEVEKVVNAVSNAIGGNNNAVERAKKGVENSNILASAKTSLSNADDTVTKLTDKVDQKLSKFKTYNKIKDAWNNSFTKKYFFKK